MPSGPFIDQGKGLVETAANAALRSELVAPCLGGAPVAVTTTAEDSAYRARINGVFLAALRLLLQPLYGQPLYGLRHADLRARPTRGTLAHALPAAAWMPESDAEGGRDATFGRRWGAGAILSPRPDVTMAG